MSTKTEDLNAIYAAIAALREASAIVEDKLVHGTNQPIYETSKQWSRVLRDAEIAYQNLRK